MEKGSHRTTTKVTNEGQGLGESLDFRMRYLGFKITGSPKFLNTGMGSPYLTCRNHQGLKASLEASKGPVRDGGLGTR